MIWRNVFLVRENFSFFHTVHSQCGNQKKFSPRSFCKNVVKVTFSLKSFTLNQFDEKIFQVWENSQNYHTVAECTVWKNEKFSLTKKIFRQINSLVIYLVKLLLSRNFCQKCVRLNFRHFNTHNVVNVENEYFDHTKKYFVKSTL